MGSQRAHIVLPPDLLQEIDAVVGPRRRSAFLVETARAELKKRKLLHFLQSEEPAWNDEPDSQRGSAAWVKALRQEGEARIRKDRGSSE